MGLGNMLGKLFKKDSEETEASKGVLSPENALSEDKHPENIYETVSLDNAALNTTDPSNETKSPGDTPPLNQGPVAAGEPEEITQERVLEALSEVYDPEIPIDIVNLGLIYGVEIDGSNVNIKMTMTAPGCPASTQIAGEARIVVLEIPGVESVDIELVWDPPWDPSKMSEEAQQSMGIL